MTRETRLMVVICYCCDVDFVVAVGGVVGVVMCEERLLSSRAMLYMR